MTLEILSQLPQQATGKPPLLFVHGAWHGAWCWAEHFMPFFADRGYPTYAVSLRGHGKSPGGLRWAGLSDYVADVKDAIAGIGESPVLIGHSMGGGVVQKYLKAHDARCAVLLASVPPHGALDLTFRVLRRHPLLFLRANLTLSLKCLIDSPDLAREYFFSPSLPDAEVASFRERLQDESYRAYLDMLAPNLSNAKKVRTPIFVLGAENDTVFPAADMLKTADHYKADVKILPGLAHDMMLDTRWRDAAEAIGRWLDWRTQPTNA